MPSKTFYAVSTLEPHYRVVVRESGETVKRFATLPAALRHVTKLERKRATA